jgi:DNA-binding response OmpR family regulator
MFKVLLVEDNPADVLLIRGAIRTSTIPADVTVASDGEQAIQLLDKFQPDLIILDLNVPKINGFGVLERHRLMGRAPVVVFTSSDRAAERANALALGAREYVVKPMTWREYFAAIRGVMERWLPTDPTIPQQS